MWLLSEVWRDSLNKKNYHVSGLLYRNYNQYSLIKLLILSFMWHETSGSIGQEQEERNSPWRDIIRRWWGRGRGTERSTGPACLRAPAVTFLQGAVLYHRAPEPPFTSASFLLLSSRRGSAPTAAQRPHVQRHHTHRRPVLRLKAAQEKSFERGGNIQIFHLQQTAGEAHQGCDITWWL